MPSSYRGVKLPRSCRMIGRPLPKTGTFRTGFELATARQGLPMTDQTERNKRNAQAFYDLMFNQCQPAEAIEQFAGDTYTQHNPAVGDGKQAFIDYFLRMQREYPGKRVHFKRAIAEG